MLHRMSVGGDQSDGGGPLVVLFVEMLVQAGMVEESEGGETIKDKVISKYL